MFVCNVLVILVFVVAGPKLRKLLSESANMPTDALTALLLKKPAVSSPVDGHELVEANMEGAQENSPRVVEGVEDVVEGKSSEAGVGSSKEKDRKRHRDGTSSRSHHKKEKEATVKDLPEGSVGAVEKASSSTPIKACRSYAGKVIVFLSCFCGD